MFRVIRILVNVLVGALLVFIGIKLKQINILKVVAFCKGNCKIAKLGLYICN